MKKNTTSSFVYHFAIRLFMVFYTMLDWTARKIMPAKRKAGDDGYTILLTGTFYSDNWIMSHLKPLSKCTRVNIIYLVSVTAAPQLEKVVLISPPGFLIKIFGGVSARLLMFMWCAFTKKPHITGGFHLLLNGLVASLVAKLSRAKSFYSCCGGEREVKGGGFSGENRLFKRMGTPDAFVERLLLKAVNRVDIVATRGNKVITYFKENGVDTNFHVIPGGIDDVKFSLAKTKTEKDIDIVFIGRLGRVKRVDLLVSAIAIIVKTQPELTAYIIGDGAEMSALKAQAISLGVEDCIHFVGQKNITEPFLRRSKVFVLPSDSEGMSLAMIEAMLCEVPVVVSDVGELSDVVESGVNGYLISDRTPESFAAHISSLLQNDDNLLKFGEKARVAAGKCTLNNIAKTWDAILDVAH